MKIEVGETQIDSVGIFRVINGKKIYQIEERTQSDIDLNNIINKVRASGLSPFDYLKLHSK